MEKELLELFDAVKKTADAATSCDGGAEESQCLEAFEQLRIFPVTHQILVSTQAERLVNLSTAEMASDQRQEETKKLEEKALFECERGGAPKATTDQFKCGRCGQRKTTYFQMQTRSADEPMTTFVACVNCNNRWKFC